MSNDFQSLTTPRRIADARFVLDVPDGWQQGRGAFGGYVLAALARSMQTAANHPEHRLRSLTATLCGPTLPGVADIAVEPLRLGSGTSTLEARLVQNGDVQAHAVAILGRDRAKDADATRRSPPPRPPWREVPLLATDGPESWPPFLRFFEVRNTGALPFANGPDARTAGWVRLRDPGTARDEPFLIAHADAFWPATFSATSHRRPMATMAFTLQVLGDLAGLDRDAPLFHESWSDATRDGFMAETRMLWGEDGRLLAINQQTFVVIK